MVTANALGGFEFTHRELRNLWTEGPRAVSVYESFAWFYAVNTGQISIRHGLRGANCALVGEQAAGLDAIGQARRCVRGGARLALAGGVDSALDPWGWVAQLSTGRVSKDPDPGRAYRPFDRTACGYLPGEGGPLDVAAAALAIRDGVIPATFGTSSVPSEYGLDLVTGCPRAGRPVSSALVLARGQGGFNAAVVLRAV